MAEADGNRTRLTEMLGHNGFEDRAHHQTRYASGVSLDGRSSAANCGNSAPTRGGNRTPFPQSRAMTAVVMRRRDRLMPNRSPRLANRCMLRPYAEHSGRTTAALSPVTRMESAHA